VPVVQGDWTSHVGRRPFIPEVIYAQRDDAGYLVPISRSDEPELWEKLVACDDPVVTKLDPITLPDGSELPFWASSSSSAPAIMNIMLDELRLAPGMSVLEIGTGTGWNAAVMAHPGAVVTTELASCRCAASA
jgi:Protein-L-isoaspartate(D-aspartate) O-methyltransferase (PCMT)